MRALVTGGLGFFGPHLLRELREEGFRITVVDRTVPVPGQGGVDYAARDLREAGALDGLCRGVDSVFHCASLVPLSRAGGLELEGVNVQGTRNVLEACRTEGVRKVVFLSSSAVYGVPAELPLSETSPRRPLGRYARSKMEAEDACAEFKRRGLDISIIRPRTLIGEGRLGILQLLFEWVRRGKNLYLLGPGSNRLQLLSARDCARACRLAAQRDCFQQDFNLGAGEFATLREDLESLARHAGTGTRFVSVPAGPGRALLRAGDLLGLTPLMDLHYGLLDKDWYFDTSKARRLLGWRPLDSNSGMLKAAYEWYLRRGRGGNAGARLDSPHQRPVREGALTVLRWLS